MTPDLIAALRARADAVTNMDADAFRAADAECVSRLAAGEADGAQIDLGPSDALLEGIAARKAVADAVAAMTAAREAKDLAALEAAQTVALATMYEHADTLSARGELTGEATVDAALLAVRAVDEVVYSMEALPDPLVVDDLHARAVELAAKADAALKGAAVIDYIPDAEAIKLAALGG